MNPFSSHGNLFIILMFDVSQGESWFLPCVPQALIRVFIQNFCRSLREASICISNVTPSHTDPFLPNLHSGKIIGNVDVTSVSNYVYNSV